MNKVTSQEWRETYFDNPGEFESLQKLLKAGGDPEFIFFLGWWIVRGADILSRPRKAPEEDQLRRFFTAFKKLDYVELIRRLGEFGVELLRNGRRLGKMLAEEEISRGLSGRQLLQVKAFVERDPFLKIFVKYRSPLGLRRGRRADPAGSFFLLAATEHMRKKTGKPHYPKVHRVLRKIRGAELDGDLGHSAMVRVAQLKQRYPEWRADFNALCKLFEDREPRLDAPPPLKAYATESERQEWSVAVARWLKAQRPDLNDLFKKGPRLVPRPAPKGQ